MAEETHDATGEPTGTTATTGRSDAGVTAAAAPRALEPNADGSGPPAKTGDQPSDVMARDAGDARAGETVNRGGATDAADPSIATQPAVPPNPEPVPESEKPKPPVRVALTDGRLSVTNPDGGIDVVFMARVEAIRITPKGMDGAEEASIELLTAGKNIAFDGEAADKIRVALGV